MTTSEPVDGGLIIGIWDRDIAINAVAGSPLQCLDDGWSHTEIHVGHPHRNHVIGHGAVPLDGAAPPALNHLVEILTCDHHVSFVS